MDVFHPRWLGMKRKDILLWELLIKLEKIVLEGIQKCKSARNLPSIRMRFLKVYHEGESLHGKP